MCLFIKNSQFSSQEKLIALNSLDLTDKTRDAGKRGTGRDGESCSLLGAPGYEESPWNLIEYFHYQNQKGAEGGWYELPEKPDSS